ncbi:MFS transporter [Desulfovibrio sp. OttesenSCG-928-O18]|nr:MFS transporter [Desulfovibrio sp. OttesenSCG-928-O18]
MTGPNAHFSGEMPPFRKALPAVLFVTAIFFINYMNRSIVGPLLVHMEQSLGLDHVQSTSFLLFLSSGFSAGVVFSGFIASKIQPRVLVGVSAMGGGCMLLLLSRAESAFEVRFFLTLLGLISGQYLTAALSTMGSLVRSEDWSRTIAVHELSPTVAFILSPVLAETAASLWGWQGAMLLMGCSSLAGGAFFLLFGKGGREKADRPSAAGVVSAFKQPVLWAFIWLFGLGIAGEFAPFSVLSLSLTSEQGLDTVTASRLLSSSRLASPFAALLGGWAMMRFGAKKTVGLFLVVHSLSLMGMALPISLIGMFPMFLAMTGQAAATAFVFPALFTVFARSFPHGQQPMLLSLSVPIASYFGNGFGPFLLGTCGEYLRFSYGYCIFGIVCLASLPLLRFFGRIEE